MIFTLAMSHEEIILEFNDDVWSREPSHDRRPFQAEPLLFVCRQIYSEVALLPYKLNRFMVSGNLSYDLYLMLYRRTSKQIELMEDVWWMYSSGQSKQWRRSGLEWLRFLCKYDCEEETRIRMGDGESEDDDDDQYDEGSGT